MIKDTNKRLNSNFIRRYKQIYTGVPWYGKNVRSLLLTANAENQEALKLMRHMLAWRYVVIDILKGNEATIELNTEADWPPSQGEGLSELMNRFDATQVELLSLIGDVSDSQWQELLWHGDYNYEFLINGIIDHDLYHVGQVALLSKDFNS